MKRLLFGFGLFWGLVSSLQVTVAQQQRYPVSLVLIEANDPEQKQDIKDAAQIVMDKLKDVCQFFDQERLQELLENFYRRNPGLDATSITEHLKELQLPTKLAIILECQVEKNKDDEFREFTMNNNWVISWYKATVKLKAVDERLKGKIYAMAGGQKTDKYWIPTSQRDSRRYAINKALENAVPQFLEQMQKRSRELAQFDLRAIQLNPDVAVALKNILQEINNSGMARVQGIMDAAEGVQASVDCPQGTIVFSQQLTERLQKNAKLVNFLCNPDGVGVLVSPKPAQEEQYTGIKFQGKVVIYIDEEMCKQMNVGQREGFEIAKLNHAFLGAKLQERLQKHCSIYNSDKLLEQFTWEAKVQGKSAFVDPTDFILEKDTLITHIVYFWTETRYEDVPKIGRSHFAKMGIRMLRTIDGKELGRFTLDSVDQVKQEEKSLQGGVRVTYSGAQGDRIAREKAVDNLAVRSLNKLVEHLQAENPSDFRVEVPKVRIRGDNFSNDVVEKIVRVVLQKMQTQGTFRVEDNIKTGNRFFECEIKSAEEDEINQQQVRVHFVEACENEEITVKVRSVPGSLLVSPASVEKEG